MKYLILCFLVFTIGCTNTNNNAISEVENIIERDFSEINTNLNLIPIRKLEISPFDEIIKKNDTNNDIKPTKKNEKPPDINRYKRYIPIGDNFFYRLNSRYKLINQDFENIKKYLSKYNNKRGQIKTKNTINFNVNKIYKQKKEMEFQEFGYPIIYENKLFLFRNYYSFYPGLGIVGSGDWHIYERENDNWKLVAKINQWLT